MSNESLVIYSMNRVGKIVPPNKQILRDISLGFYYGAKIGVLGLNGAGKSTLLRIMAGVDKDFIGEIAQSKGYTTGLLEQEPKLDENKTVIEVVREAVQPIVELMARYDEVNAKFAEPDADFDALVLPGGVMSPDKLRMNEQAVAFVGGFFENNKPVAAICHGPWTLIETGELKGRTVTSYPSLKTDLINAGANWVDKEVVVDNGLVTSRNPGDLPAFCRKMLEEIGEGVHEHA